MRIFKNKQFSKWADDEGLVDDALRDAVKEIEQGLVDANLGGSVYKKRIGIQGRGKSGGLRTLLAYVKDEKTFFMFGFSKNERDNIEKKEKQALKNLAEVYISYSDKDLEKLIKGGVFKEVAYDE